MAQPCSAPRCYHKWEIKHFVSQQNTLAGLHPYPLNFICASCKSVSHLAAASFSAVSHFLCVCVVLQVNLYLEVNIASNHNS